MLKVYSPYDNSLIKEITMDSPEQAEAKIAKAHELFSDRSKWLPAHQRRAILEKTVVIMRERKDELVRIAAQEGGKPFNDTVVEVDRAINGVILAIEHMAQIKGEEIPMGLTPSSVNRLAFTTKEPVGVVMSVSAFNHPLNLTVHQTVPAIAVGCPVLFKPAQITPLSGLAFIEILKEAGLPEGWCEPVVSDRHVAESLVSDARVNFFSFIGSGPVGWYLRSKLSEGTLCALEHGGAAPVIVDADADVVGALPGLVKGGFYHAGQVCVSVQRVYAHESLAVDLANSIATEAKKLVVGDPLDPATEVGPLIKTAEVDRVDEWVQEAIDQGATLLCGGKRISETCYEPTVLLNPSQESTVSQKEIFGPVVCVYSFSDREEAIRLANSLPYVFQASVITENLNTALDVVKKLNATAVMVNDHTAFRVDWMPFGGRGSSGAGVGGIGYSMDEMTCDKLMVIKSSVL